MTVFKPYHYFSIRIGGPWILWIGWMLVQSCTLWHYGIVEAVDSDFYLSNAHALSQGHFPTDRGLWYVSYSFFLALVMGIGGNLTLVVLLQFLFSGLAALALYKVVYRLFQSYTIAFLAVLQYLLWLKIHQWNSYIYTESLFISCSLISFALLCLSKNTLQYVFTALVILFTLFLRPTGICFFIGICAYFIYWLRNKKNISALSLWISTVSVAIVLIIFMNTLLTEYIYYFIDSYSKAEIIYPNINFIIETQPLDLPSPSDPPLLQLVLFICYNPLYFLKLFGLKCFLFLSNVKPYFSWIHNLGIVLILYPIYGLAIYGFKKMRRTRENVFMIVYIILQTLTVSMTSENWDGRFLILILPFVFIYSAFGITTLLKKWRHHHLQAATYRGP